MDTSSPGAPPTASGPLGWERALALFSEPNRLDAIFETISDGLVVFDARANVVALNAIAQRLLGWTPGPDGAVPRKLIDALAPRDAQGKPLPVPQWPVARALRGETVHDLVIGVAVGDGRPAWLQVFAAPMRSGGAVVGVVARFFDVTERFRAEQALHESEARLQASERLSRVGHYVFDVTGDRWVSSQVLDEVFGIDETFARTSDGWLSLVHPDDRARLKAHLGGVLTGAHPFDAEYRVVAHASRVVRVVHGLGEVALDPQGRVARMFGTIQDVTQARDLEAQLQKSRVLESLGRLASGVAHDFNNLLTVVFGYTELMQADLQNGRPVGADAVESVLAAAERARDLTRQLLSFARRQTVSPEVYDFALGVRACEKMLRRVLGGDVRMVLQVDDGPLMVMADPAQLESVVMNLGVNARDAMPRGGTLTVALHALEVDEAEAARWPPGAPRGPAVRLTVRDTGEGMSAEVREHAFEPFFTTKDSGKGTGLGLASVQGVVAQAGGVVRLDSAPGAGTCVEVLLRRVEAAPAAKGAASPRALPRGTESILLVEDDLHVRTALVRMLEGHGYQVASAGSGEEACALFAGGQSFHLLVTDVVMPGMTGFEVADRFLAASPRGAVLYVTGHAEDVVARRGTPAPGTLVLGKPFPPHLLLVRVRQALDARRAAAPP